MITSEIMELKEIRQKIENELKNIKMLSPKLYKELSSRLEKQNDISSTNKSYDDLRNELLSIESIILDNNNYFKLLNKYTYLTNYIKETNYENTEEYVSLMKNLLWSIGDCPQILEPSESEMLDNIYLLSLSIIKYELLNNNKSDLLNAMLPIRFHREYLNRIINIEIEEILSSSFNDHELTNYLKNLILLVKTEGIETSLVNTDIIFTLLLLQNNGKINDKLKSKIVNKIDEINSLTNVIRDNNDDYSDLFERNRKELAEKIKFIKIDIIAAILTLSLSLGLGITSNNNTKKYEKYTTTTTVTTDYSEPESIKEAEDKLTSFIESKTERKSCTLKVLDDVYEENGSLLRNYRIYDLNDYLEEYNAEDFLLIDENLIKDKEIEQGVETLLIRSEENIETSRIVTFKTQEKNKSKKALDTIFSIISAISALVGGIFTSEAISYSLQKRKINKIIEKLKLNLNDVNSKRNEDLLELTELRITLLKMIDSLEMKQKDDEDLKSFKESYEEILKTENELKLKFRG